MVFDYEADCSCNARMLLQPNCKEPVGSELRREAPEVREKNKIEPRRREPGTFVRICPMLFGFSHELWIQTDAAASEVACKARRNHEVIVFLIKGRSHTPVSASST